MLIEAALGMAGMCLLGATIVAITAPDKVIARYGAGKVLAVIFMCLYVLCSAVVLADAKLRGAWEWEGLWGQIW